jgi:hypothetical protein
MMYDIPAAITAISSLVTKFIPDRDKQIQFQAELQGKLLDIEAQVSHDQAAIDAKEADSPSLFIAGWRPACGWVCVLGFTWEFVAEPFLSWAYTLFTKQPFPAPSLHGEALTTLLMALLGLGGLRTFEKYTKSEDNR